MCGDQIISIMPSMVRVAQTPTSTHQRTFSIFLPLFFFKSDDTKTKNHNNYHSNNKQPSPSVNKYNIDLC